MTTRCKQPITPSSVTKLLKFVSISEIWQPVFLFFLVEIAADVGHGEFDVPEEEFSETLVRKGNDNLSPYTSY